MKNFKKNLSRTFFYFFNLFGLYASSPEAYDYYMNCESVSSDIPGENSNASPHCEYKFTQHPEEDPEKIFIKSILFAENIRLMGEEQNNAKSDNIEKIKALIKNADELVIIGFGFDRDNMEYIGLSLENMKKKDTIKWMNFKGEEQAIERELEKVRKASNNNLKIICSTKDSVSNTYQKDFRDLF